MHFVFVIGLAIEVAGAALLAAEPLWRDAFTIARRGLTIVSPDAPPREGQAYHRKGWASRRSP